MRETGNEVVIRGDPDHIYSLAAAVEEWPTFLPHYRWVRAHSREGNRRTVEMAAWRPLIGAGRGIPVRWVSYQWLWPEERRITFRHIGGLSRGMAVEWRIEALGEGREDGMTGLSGNCKLQIDNCQFAIPPNPGAPSGLVRVSITHELRLEVPVVRTAPGQWVVGEVFVKAVAGRTLACLKRRVEGTGDA